MSILGFFKDIEADLGIVSTDLSAAGAFVLKSWTEAKGVALASVGMIGVADPVLSTELAADFAVADVIVKAIDEALVTAAQIATLTNLTLTTFNTYFANTTVTANAKLAA